MKVKCPDRTLVELWISYAQEFLGETQFLKNNKIVVNYNQWFIDVDYRQQLAKQLNIKFSDAGFNDVKGQGGGSSFDGIAFRGKAAEMDILNRWKVFADQPQYQKLIDNTELQDYSKRIFVIFPERNAIFERFPYGSILLDRCSKVTCVGNLCKPLSIKGLSGFLSSQGVKINSNFTNTLPKVNPFTPIKGVRLMKISWGWIMNRFPGYSHQLQRHIRNHTLHWVSPKSGQTQNGNNQLPNLNVSPEISKSLG